MVLVVALLIQLIFVVLMVEESTSGINERTLRNTSKIDFLGCSFYPFFHANLILVVQSRRLPRFSNDRDMLFRRSKRTQTRKKAPSELESEP